MFEDAFNERVGFANDYKVPAAKDKVSNFKGKVVNQIWPHFHHKIIKNKREQELTPNLRMMKNHMRLYQEAVDREKAKAQDAAAHRRNYASIEEHMGVAPSSNTNAPNTSLVLEPVAQGRSTQGAGSLFQTPSVGVAHRGIGGYAPSVAYDGNSSFSSLIQSILQPAALCEQVTTTAAVTPAAAATQPPTKKTKVSRRIKFIRQEFSTEVVSNGDSKTIKDLKHACTDAQTDRVFRFPHATNVDLKAKKAVLKVKIGDEFEQEYDIVKQYTVEEILNLLSQTARETIPITMEIKVVKVQNENDEEVLETYDSE